MSTNKLIICSGDSYTAGDELAGDLLVPGYTSYRYTNSDATKHDPVRIALHKKLTDAIEELRATGWHNYEAYENSSKDRAWPKHLERLVNCTVINCSRGGISNEEIAHRAIETFHMQLSTWDPKNITVILMPTTKERFGYPVHNKVNGGEYEFQSIMPQNVKHKLEPEVLQHVLTYHVTHMTDYDNLWKSVTHLIAAKEYFESFGSTVKFVDSCLWGWTVSTVDGDKQDRVPYLKRLIPISAMMNSLAEIKEEALAGYHFSEKVHVLFAEKISKLLDNA